MGVRTRRVGYHGGMLAQWLREEFEHTPIVLTSGNGKSKRWRRVNPYLFDAEVSPDEMIQQPESVVAAEFLQPDAQEAMKDARYTGVLAPPEGRWWKDRLVSAALDVMVDAGMSGILLHRYFPEAFAQVHGRPLQLARSACVYSKKKPAPRVCYVLKKPVRIEYSLVYQPDSRPTVMDDARVSFTAIRTSEEVFDEYFPPSSRHLVDEVRIRYENELGGFNSPLRK